MPNMYSITNIKGIDILVSNSSMTNEDDDIRIDNRLFHYGIRYDPKDAVGHPTTIEDYVVFHRWGHLLSLIDLFPYSIRCITLTLEEGYQLLTAVIYSKQYILKDAVVELKNNTGGKK
jgi:hypothetical protein